MKILVLSSLEDKHLAQIRAVDPGLEVSATSEAGRGAQLAGEAEVIVGWHLPDEILAGARALRWIHSTAAGIDTLLVPSVMEGRVLLTSSVGIHATVLPEHVMALMLSFSRRLHIALRNQIRHKWDRQAAVGEEIEGRTLGVLGLGAIGSALARRASAFGMRIVGTKRTPQPIPCVERVLPPEGTDEVLRLSDFVVILLPLTDETRGLIDGRALGLMKRSAILINVSRGAIVQEAALIHALSEGTIAGAGLDVFDREPLQDSSPLFDMENVIITPHVSGASPTYMDRAIPLFCENLRRYLAGAPMLNVVDPRRGY